MSGPLDGILVLDLSRALAGPWASQTLANQASNYLVTGKSPGLSGNAHPNIVPYQVFDTADAPIIVAVRNDGQFASLCKVIDCEHLSSDPRYCSNAVRVINRDTLVPLLATEFAKHTSAHWLSELEVSGIPVGPVNSIAEAFADPHVIERLTVMQLQRADLGAVPSVRSPIRFQNYATEAGCAPPALGDSTGAVLREIGFDEDEIKALFSDHVVA